MADTEEQTEGRAASNVPDALIVFHHSELSKIEREEAKANDALKAVRKRLKSYRKTIQADGLKLKNFDRAREMLLADEGEVKSDLAETGRILRAFKSPLGPQLDLFDEPDRATQDERWRYQGFLVGARGGDLAENPHAQGDRGYKVWIDGYKGAQASIAMGMKQSSATAASDGDGDDAPEAEAKTPRAKSGKAETPCEKACVDVDEDVAPVDPDLTIQ